MVILEANPNYWDKTRLPRVARIVFDNTTSQKDAVELLKTTEGRVDVVTELNPLETLRVAESPFATVVKSRGVTTTVFGHFNMRRAASPWRDVRVRQAANLAVNRADLIRYATNGNGVPIPALAGARAFGHNPDLAPYPFDPARARELLTEAGYSGGFPITLIAPDALEVQATVTGKMLEQAGFKTDVKVLDSAAYARKTIHGRLDEPADKQAWDIALTAREDALNFPPFVLYHWYALDGPEAWGSDPSDLRRLYDDALRTVDPDKQRDVIRGMERWVSEQAYFLALYNPIKLYAVNKGVQFVPYVNGVLILTETSVADQHWSLRKGGGKR